MRRDDGDEIHARQTLGKAAVKRSTAPATQESAATAEQRKGNRSSDNRRDDADNTLHYRVMALK